MSQTTAQKVVALQDLADDLHAEIRALRQRADRADAAIARVRELHKVEQLNHWRWCPNCREVHPCATLRALDGDA